MGKFNSNNFYAECKELFGSYAKAIGYAPQGIDEVPDLKPKRELFVATLLGDKALSEACHDDPTIYYYNVIRYCLTAGIEYGAQWQLKPEGFEEEGYDQILYKNNVGRSSDDITTDIASSPAAWKKFLIGLHRVWGIQMQPFLTNEDEDTPEAVLQSCFSVFQLGVAIALDKFDEPAKNEASEEDDAAEADAAEKDAADDSAAEENESKESADAEGAAK